MHEKRFPRPPVRRHRKRPDRRERRVRYHDADVIRAPVREAPFPYPAMLVLTYEPKPPEPTPLEKIMSSLGCPSHAWDSHIAGLDAAADFAEQQDEAIIEIACRAIEPFGLVADDALRLSIAEWWCEIDNGSHGESADEWADSLIRAMREAGLEVRTIAARAVIALAVAENLAESEEWQRQENAAIDGHCADMAAIDDDPCGRCGGLGYIEEFAEDESGELLMHTCLRCRGDGKGSPDLPF